MILELKNIVKGYHSDGRYLPVLKGLSMSFPKGKSVGILGRNGAGKSTLLRLIAGTDQPDSGQVIRHGRMSWPIGFRGGFNGSLSGEENCRFVARVYGQDVDYITAFALDFSELGDYFTRPVRTYSSGMRARLAFGLSMAMEFEVYLVDEIIAVGDAPFRRKCRRAFQERRERASLIMVSHNIKTLVSNCDLCAVLSEGQLILYDTVKEAEAAATELNEA